MSDIEKKFTESIYVWEIPPKCHKPRWVQYQEEFKCKFKSFSLEEANIEAPVAIIDSRFSAKNAISIEYRWYKNVLWVGYNLCDSNLSSITSGENDYRNPGPKNIKHF